MFVNLPKVQAGQQQQMSGQAALRPHGVECEGVLSNGGIINAGPFSQLNSLLREEVNGVRMVVSPLRRGPGNILDGKSYR